MSPQKIYYFLFIFRVCGTRKLRHQVGFVQLITNTNVIGTIKMLVNAWLDFFVDYIIISGQKKIQERKSETTRTYFNLKSRLYFTNT